MSQSGATFTVDFSQVPDREPVPDGEYTLECVNCELKVSQGAKTSGTQMLGVHWKVVGGEYDNRRVFDNVLLGGDALWRAKQLFEALFGKGQTSFSMSVEELAGSRVDARITQEVWAEEDGGDGEARNRIAKYRSTGDAPATEAGSLTGMFNQ